MMQIITKYISMHHLLYTNAGAGDAALEEDPFELEELLLTVAVPLILLDVSKIAVNGDRIV